MGPSQDEGTSVTMGKAITIAIVLTFFSAAPALARPYQIGMIHWIAYSPLNVADAKGFWRQQGVEVELINFASNQELNQALAQKRIDLALDMMGSWVGMYMQGVPLTLIAETDWSYGGDKIIAKKDLDLSKLKGRTIGVYLNQPSAIFFLHQYLLRNNVQLTDVRIIEVAPEALADSFIAGRFRLIVNYDPQALRAMREGDGHVAATSASFPGCIPEGLVARTDRLQTIPKSDLAGIYKGWVEAVKWSKNADNWPAYCNILNTRTFDGEAPYSDGDLKAMLNSVSIHDVRTQLERNRDGGGLHTYLRQLRMFLKDNGMLKKDFTPSEIFDNSVIVEVLQTMGS
jgi:NitT/TauT family transport system substrate-binding protein